MRIRRLLIEDLRNIRRIDLRPEPGLNLIYGPNGSGKTSILEAIYLLARGRSFRDQTGRSIARIGAAGWSVYAEIFQDKKDGASRIGLGTIGHKKIARRDGRDVRSIAEVAQELAVSLVTGRSHVLFDGPPDVRRGFLDWGVFHVEPEHMVAAKRYREVVEQRNAALRGKGEKEIGVWDRLLVEYGLKVDKARRKHSALLEKELKNISAEFEWLNPVELRYRSGWPGEAETAASILDEIGRRRDRERARGFTLYGPHRGDFKFRIGKTRLDASDLSEGQKKVLACGMELAGASIRANSGQGTVFLLDDFFSEFDRHHRDLILSLIVGAGHQVLATSPAMAGSELPELRHATLFHVEQGMLRA